MSRYKQTFNPCDECNYSYSKNNELSSMCKICEFKQYLNLEEQGRLIEQKHGYWKLEEEPNGKPYCFHCSVCDDDFRHIGITTAYKYCPNCGAKMDEVK